jgi:signal transduction histidine kinase
MSMKRITPILASVALLAFAAAPASAAEQKATGTKESPASRKTETAKPAAQGHPGQGTVNSVDAKAGKVNLSEEVVSPGDVIEASMLAVRIQALKGEVALNVELPDGLPKVRVDEMRLRQIMINLLSNAVKFSPAGGEVTISAALVRGGGLELCVADTGIGMSEDEVKTAMELFSQVDTRLARHFEGTGLGLPLAKQLTELHGGRLTVESVPEAGTKVRVWLPPQRVVSEKHDWSPQFGAGRRANGESGWAQGI